MKKYRLQLLAFGTIAIIVVMFDTGSPLKTPGTPYGILDLEFSYNAAKTNFVFQAWGGDIFSEKVQQAKLNTWLDFLFLFCYSFLLYNLCRLIPGYFTGVGFSIGQWLANGALVAGILDIFENTGMLFSLNGYISDITSGFTFLCASLKWILVLLAVGYISIGSIILLFRKGKRPGS